MHGHDRLVGCCLVLGDDCVSVVLLGREDDLFGGSLDGCLFGGRSCLGGLSGYFFRLAQEFCFPCGEGLYLFACSALSLLLGLTVYRLFRVTVLTSGYIR